MHYSLRCFVNALHCFFLYLCANTVSIMHSSTHIHAFSNCYASVHMCAQVRCICVSSICVHVCVSVRINEVQVRVSIGFYHDFNLWICLVLELRLVLTNVLGMPLQPFQKSA